MRVRFPEPVRVAFWNGFEPKAIGDSKEKRYSAAFPLVPGSANDKAVAAAVEAVAKAKWKEKAPAIMKKLREDGKVCYVRKPLTDDEGQVYDGFEGMHAVNAGQSEKKGAPKVLGRDREKLTQADGIPYSGCYVIPLLDFWAQDNQYGRRINAELKGVQFVKHGDAFGGSAPASPEEFEDLGVEDEEATTEDEDDIA